MLNLRNIALTLAVTAALGVAAIAAAPHKTIVDVAAGNKDFSTLVSLVKKAGLVETLEGEGPFTVFAPTNKAFEALPKETLEAVQADPELLKKVLLYHVVPGKVTSKEVVNVKEAKTALKDAKLKVSVREGKVYVNDSKVVAVDVMAENGVIHVIDAVLIPPMEAKASNGGTCSGGL
jgi:uncharacterized surface protein with fasciclin (FAS1) repeats